MSDRRDFQFFDNYEEDGQLSLFSADYDDWDEDWTEDAENGEVAESDGVTVSQDGAAKPVKSGVAAEKKAVLAEASTGISQAENSGPDIRVKYCACCGKLLFVREETAGFRSECNNCGIKYFQKL